MRLILIGDAPGVSQLLHHVPAGNVVALVGASIRMDYIAVLEQIAGRLKVPLLVQPRYGTGEYAAFVRAAGALQADLIWVNSYSMILRDDLLATLRLGGINIHAALLPRNRGCNPIQWGIINGETEGGVTLHEITAGIDEGPIIDQRRVPIDIDDDWMVALSHIAMAIKNLTATHLPWIPAKNWLSVTLNLTRATDDRHMIANDLRPDAGRGYWPDAWPSGENHHAV